MQELRKNSDSGQDFEIVSVVQNVISSSSSEGEEEDEGEAQEDLPAPVIPLNTAHNLPSTIPLISEPNPVPGPIDPQNLNLALQNLHQDFHNADLQNQDQEIIRDDNNQSPVDSLNHDNEEIIRGDIEFQLDIENQNQLEEHYQILDQLDANPTIVSQIESNTQIVNSVEENGNQQIIIDQSEVHQEVFNQFEVDNQNHHQDMPDALEPVEAEADPVDIKRRDSSSSSSSDEGAADLDYEHPAENPEQCNIDVRKLVSRLIIF